MQHTQSQNAAILKHLQEGNAITALEALNLFGCLRLSGRIHDIKEQGHTIQSKMIKVGGKCVAEYRLVNIKMI